MRISIAIAIFVGALTLSRESAAESPLVATPTRAMTAKSRQLFNDGVTAYRQQRWDDAHAAFLAAWALVRHYSVEGNLADCELKLGRYPAAAEHFAHYVREMGKDPESTPAERADGEARLARAREKVGVVNVRVNQPGSKVYVDGKFIGTDPLEYPVFIEPGDHGIDARSEGYPAAHAAITARAGVTQAVTLTLERPAEASPSSPPPPPPPPPPAAPPRVGIGWIVATGVLAAGAIGTGIGFTVAANDKGSETTTLRAGLGPSACFNPAGAGIAACSATRAALQDESSLRNAEYASFVGGSLLALAAGGLGVWSATAPRATDERKTAVHVVPVVGAQNVGLILVGAW
jgi:hypothetical protein